jgi:hypothetical protein
MKVALVHDWLTGMRGGEAVLEALCARYPAAPIFTLVHVPGSVSPAIESHPIVTSFVQRLPRAAAKYRSYLPLFPAAVERFDLAAYDLVISSSHCVAGATRTRRPAPLLPRRCATCGTSAASTGRGLAPLHVQAAMRSRRRIFAAGTSRRLRG